MKLDSNVPSGPIEKKWEKHRFDMKLVNPANKRKYTVIMVGSGLAGAGGAASMAELGYNVKCFCYQDCPRRAHSIAAQGGINAAKNYQNDGDSVQRLFYDTVKGGDFRSREANVYRLAEISVKIIDQCVAQGVPFAREYGGLLDNRSFGGAQVSRTFYARGQTGQQLLLGAYQALERQIGLGTVEMYPRHEMQELVVVDGRARGVIVRDMVTGEVETHLGDAVCLATGGYGNVFYLATYAKGCNATAIWRAYKKGAAFANPCYTQIHPTCIPVTGEYQSKLTLMSESLRNDGRIWVPKKKGDTRPPHQIPEAERDYYLERMYPSFGNLAPRDIASRAAKRVCDEGRGVGKTGLGVYLDFAGRDPAPGPAQDRGEVRQPLRDVRADHRREPVRDADADLPRDPLHDGRPVGGLQPDEHDPGPVRARRGELLRPRREPPRRVRAHAGARRRLLHHPVHDRRLPGAAEGRAHSGRPRGRRRAPSRARAARTKRLLGVGGKRSATSFHRELGKIMWDHCGMARDRKGLEHGAREDPGPARGVLAEPARAGRRRRSSTSRSSSPAAWPTSSSSASSCASTRWSATSRAAGTSALEHQTADGEAKRDDENFCHVAAWEYKGDGVKPERHVEPLTFEFVHLRRTRSYK